MTSRLSDTARRSSLDTRHVYCTRIKRRLRLKVEVTVESLAIEQHEVTLKLLSHAGLRGMRISRVTELPLNMLQLQVEVEVNSAEAS